MFGLKLKLLLVAGFAGLMALVGIYAAGANHAKDKIESKILRKRFKTIRKARSVEETVNAYSDMHLAEEAKKWIRDK